jgi:hypothetical protein
MAVGLGDLLQTMQQGVQAINNLATQIGVVFPSVTAASTSGPSVAGTISYSSSLATGFMLVELSSGTTVKVPYYDQ